MADGQIRIRIAATQDRSVETIFGGIEKRALKLRETLAKALGGTTAGRGRNPLEQSFAGIERASKRAADGVDKTWNQELARLNKIAAAQDRLFERTERNKVRAAERGARERQRIEERANREIERAFRESARAADREAAKGERQRRQFAERTSHRATRFLFPPPTGAIDVGRRVAGDILRGAGIDFSLQGSVQRGVSLERGAVQLSNSAYIPGVAGLASQRVNPAQIEQFVRAQALKAGMSSNATMEGLGTFVGRTGDLATGRATLGGLLKLGKATGTDPQDLLAFAGTVAATMYDSPAKDAKEASERAAMINRTVNVAAYSGKLGTTEISDLAKYGPKLAATAGQFGGDPEKNLGEMYALAQLGLKGGAASAAQATTSVASMVNTLKTPARRKQFKARGVELEDENGLFRSASDIITDSIVAAGTDTEAFKKMWANVQGARSVEGLRQIYLKAGGGQAGIDAIRGQFKQLGGSMSGKEIDDSFNASMGTSSSRAAQFQERWDAVFAKMAQEVLPALEQLADPTIKLAGVFADAVKFAADMPFTFGALIVAASVLRAGLESWGRAALERRIMGLPAGTPGIPGTPAAGVGMGGLFTGGGGYTGARGVINSGAGAMVATLGASLAIDQATSQNEALKQQTGGKGIFDLMWGSISEGKGFFAQADEELNRQARAEAAARDAVATAPTDASGNQIKPLTQEEMAAAIATGNAKGVRITNLNELRLVPPGPAVSPNGRSPAPGP